MRRPPTADQTMTGPTYEGRPLHRPDEQVVDQGAVFDIQTLLTRRRALAAIGAGAATALLAACSDSGADGAAPSATTESATSAGEIPDETAGPYPGDGSNGPDVLTRSGIVRRDIRSSLGGGATAKGVPLTISLAVKDMAKQNAPFAGVAVYAWHCDAGGGYSMYSDGITEETYLRGVQVADANGDVTFTSIFPGCYTGRWPHIHFEVYPNVASITDHTRAIATSQLALPEDACKVVYEQNAYRGSAQNLSAITLASDNVFGDDSGVSQLASMTGNAVSGYRAALDVRIDTRTAPTAGGPNGGGPMGPPPPGARPGR